ncbi:Rrf2 family transcriptional regulator [Campylobacter concisus]|uniref:Rrf2 family transcriptional regulator n=2 Tax=Campylobacter concisus TaxID=199 RepID=UPI000CD810DF|nr:Rrf2 family transcriptional regulator [Campylobacter concisus]
MQVGIKFSTAIHVVLAACFFKDEKVTSEFIAGSINTNPVIVRRLLGTLKAAGLVNVVAGVGGVSLAKEPKDITLLQIFNAVNDKEKLFKIHSDSPKACPLGSKIEGLLTNYFLKAQEALESELRSITLQDLLDELINL